MSVLLCLIVIERRSPCARLDATARWIWISGMASLQLPADSLGIRRAHQALGTRRGVRSRRAWGAAGKPEVRSVGLHDHREGHRSASRQGTDPARAARRRAFVYRAKIPRQEVERARAQDAVSRLLGPRAACRCMAALVDAVDAVDPKLLNELERAVAAHRRPKRWSVRSPGNVAADRAPGRVGPVQLVAVHGSGRIEEQPVARQRRPGNRTRWLVPWWPLAPALTVAASAWRGWALIAA